ncbi:hypothetical protein SKAU_G00183040 [Synaphobranchus kaupii]|uniref:Uncharacterized protein n=1 Tax=Synaphobranchus kaupii TaxID=118154 RepID=A0A9Q1IWP0_SYNKA|nr:hypothetical protein SKAU_G00183040 [Synaphobranchus kaupii]
MATILPRCLYFLILLSHLRIPHVAVDNALLEVKPFFRQELTVSQDWRSRNVSECTLAVENRDPITLLSLPPQTLEEHRITGEAGLNRSFSSEAERPAAGGHPFQFHRVLLLVQKRLRTFSDMIIGSLPEAWQPGSTPLAVPLGAVVFTTALEILLFLVFTWRTVCTVKTPVPEVEEERSRYLRKLQAEERKSRKLEERLEALVCDGAALEKEKDQLKAQAEALEQRLQVLDQLCQEKDSILQQKVIQEQVDQQEMETVLNTYKLRVQELRLEKQRAEYSYRRLIEYHQQRAYENLMKACTLEQVLEQERRETGRLRQLLVISVKLAEFQLSANTSAGSDHLSLTPETAFSNKQSAS